MMRYRMAASGTAHMVDPEGVGVLCANRAAARWPEIVAEEPPGPLCRTCAEALTDRQMAVWTEELQAQVSQDLPQWRALCRLIARQRERQVKPRELPPDLREWLGPPWGSRGDLGTAIPPRETSEAGPVDEGRWRRVALVHVIGLVFYWNEAAAWRLRPDWKKRQAQIEAGQWPAPRWEPLSESAQAEPEPEPERSRAARGPRASTTRKERGLW